MTVLVTGGTGKTGSILTRLLHEANHPFLMATRTGKAPEPYRAVQFDWSDPTTFENPFHADPTIDRVYLIAPIVLDPMPMVKPFIDLAISKGVKRFVFLSASRSNPGDPAHGGVHQYLIDIGVEYVVLRPTGFMSNWGLFPWYSKSIKENSVFYSIHKDGRIPWVSLEDIAQAALDSLTTDKYLNKDIYVLGPTAYTDDEALKLLSSAIGREITHIHNKTPQDQVAHYVKCGFQEEFAGVLAKMDVEVAEGKEEALVHLPADRKYVGKHTLLEYFEKNKELW